LIKFRSQKSIICQRSSLSKMEVRLQIKLSVKYSVKAMASWLGFGF
jgi:hypothetical protein